MSILADVLERLAKTETAIETYNRHGDLVHRLTPRAFLDAICAHRPAFAAWGSFPRTPEGVPLEGGVSQGGFDRRVALLFRSDETVEFLIAAFAALAEGLTVVPLYPNWTDEQQQLYVARYRLRSVAVGEGFRARVEGWRRLVTHVIPVTAKPSPVAVETFRRAEVFPRDLPEDHPCALIFTSGTSGDLAKCTLITQANLAAAIENITRLEFLRPGMTLHCPLSVSHIFAFVVILGFLGLAPKRVIFSDVQYLARIPEDKIGKIDGMILIPIVLNRMRAAFYERLARPGAVISKEGTSKAGAPKDGETADPALARLARMPVFARRALSWLARSSERLVIAREAGKIHGFVFWPLAALAGRLLGPLVRRRLASPEFVVVGGAKPSLRSMAFLEVMGIRCLQGWGMTETTGPLAVCRLGDRFRGAFGTCGDLFTGAKGAIDGEELIVEGPQIAAGYLEPDGRLVPFRGRVRTGDFAVFDRRGRLQILGKASDRITLQNGINYNPPHYEELIHAFDLRLEHRLEEAVVIGDGQPRMGCVFYLREPQPPAAPVSEAPRSGAPNEPSNEPSNEHVRKYLAFLLREINATLHADDQLGPWAISATPLRDSGVLSPSAKLIRRRVEERYAYLFIEKRERALAGV